jgi:flagellar hook-basal body complex protein FliE
LLRCAQKGEAGFYSLRERIEKMAIPAAAAAAYRAAASITTPNVAAGAGGIAPADLTGPGSFSDFLSGAVKDSISTIRQGEQAAQAQVAGNANIVDVVNSVNSAELSLDTMVAVRDKVVAAYQSILNMPI